MTPREVIAKCLVEQPAFGFTDKNCLQGADAIVEYLKDEGWTFQSTPVVRFVQDEL